jgi:hypothetical protein
LSLPLSIQPSLDLAHITTPLYPFCQIPISLLADPLCSVSQGSYAWLCFFIPSLLPSPFLTKCFLKCIFFTYLPFFSKICRFLKLSWGNLTYLSNYIKYAIKIFILRECLILKSSLEGWAWWFTPIIPATQEAGIRNLVPGQAWQKVSKTPSQPIRQV